ncbi:hypothetical protein WJX74_007462 [Apatococcus lobatus]|uniref:Uncharacterized protein n=1 Tax=Apatococcus lobatus TaxID=904363 RepID=A0AAW1S1V6_9CHLO
MFAACLQGRHKWGKEEKSPLQHDHAKVVVSPHWRCTALAAEGSCRNVHRGIAARPQWKVPAMAFTQARRALCDLVDGHTHEAWARAAADLLRPSAKPGGRWSGAEWQSAIRHEWEFQQPVRSGVLRQVAKISAERPASGKWAVTSAHGPYRNYLLSPQKDRSIQLLNVDASDAEPVLLSMRMYSAYYAFVRKDSLLCIVDAHHTSSNLSALRWQTFAPATGKTISCTHQHFWFDTFDCYSWMELVFHATSHRAVALTDAHLPVVMEADSLQEVSRFLVAPRHQERGKVPLSIGSLAWSHTGAMLAVHLGKSKRFQS